jgi:thymidylate synthase ThyX
MFEVKILADSMSAENKSRLTTALMTYPRMVHSEHLRHRAFSFNVASSRAIPVEKILKAASLDPVIPIHFGAAQKGMQAFNEVADNTKSKALEIILRHSQYAIQMANELLELGLHKQVVNRYIEPFSWCTVICSGTDRAWRHFYSLRCHEMAEPHIRYIAEITYDAMEESKPKILQEGELHLPLFGFDNDDEITDNYEKMKISSARCARVSYLTHHGLRDTSEDIRLFETLVSGRHWSPLEHPAICCLEGNGGNYGKGWTQFRKTFEGEFTP